MTNNTEKKRDLFSILLPILLIVAVFLSVISHLAGIELETETYNNLKSYFFTPLKKWTFVVIAAAMFSVFFRSPQGNSNKFLVLLLDIMMLYMLSTLIANIYAFSAFNLLPFVDAIAPLMADAKSVFFEKTNQSQGIPLVIWVMIIGFSSSIIFRYLFHGFFALIAKNICALLVTIFKAKFLDKASYIRDLKNEYHNALQTNNNIDYSLAFINFFDKIIFAILMLILLLAPLAVYSSFLEILNVRGFHFFADLSKFIAFYIAILFSYKFFVIVLIRKIFCYGINGETYKSFLIKALPVIATAGTTSSSVATLAANIKAAQSLVIPDENMKNKGHNRALMPIGATFNMDGTSISLIIYFLLAANLAGMEVDFIWVVLTAIGLSVGTAAVPSASLIMLTSMYSAFAIPASITSKLLSIIIAVDPIHDRVRTMTNTWGDLNMVYIVQCKRGMLSMLSRLFGKNI